MVLTIKMTFKKILDNDVKVLNVYTKKFKTLKQLPPW